MTNKLFREIIRENATYTVVAIACQILFALSVTLVSYSLSILFEAYGVDKRAFYQSLVFVGAVVVATTLLSCLSDYTKAQYIKKTNESLKFKMTANTVNIAYNVMVTGNTGQALSWFVNDAEQIETQAFANFLNLIFGVTVVTSAFFYILKSHWLLAVVSLILLTVSLMIPKLTQGYIQEASKNYTAANETYTESIRDNIEGLSVFFIGNALPMFQTKMTDAITLREKNYFQFSMTQAKIGSLMLLTSLLSQIGLIAFSLYLSSLGLTATGSVLSIAGLSGNLFNGVQSLTGTLSTFKAAEVLLNKFQSMREDKQAFSGDIDTLSLNAVSLTYGENTVFDDFSYTFTKGKKYVIVGNSGSGKSTLLKLLMGLSHADSGQVKVNGLDIKDIHLASFYHHIAYIEQSVYLFNGTIRDNITLGHPVSEKTLDEVLRKVQLDSFIKKQPLGLDTLVASNGQGLSGGEKQRIALARALVKEVDFILMDESTSQLDNLTREAIEETILSFQTIGLIYVSHHTEAQKLHQFDEILNSQSFSL